MITFKVLDPATGKEPDTRAIADNEEWARELFMSDIEGFAIAEDGALVLLDECGNYAYPPEGRFTVVVDVPGAKIRLGGDYPDCSIGGTMPDKKYTSGGDNSDYRTDGTTNR